MYSPSSKVGTSENSIVMTFLASSAVKLADPIVSVATIADVVSVTKVSLSKVNS